MKEISPGTVDIVIPMRQPSAGFVDRAAELLALSDAPGAPFVRLILVDDASGDDTWDRAAGIHRQFPGRVRAYRLGRRSGQPAATCLGLLRSEAPVVVTMDDDGQHPASELWRLVELVGNGRAQLVYGVPREDRRPWGRRAAAACYRWGIAAAYRLPTSAATSFRCLSGTLRERLRVRGKVHGLFDIALMQLAGAAGVASVEVGFEYRPAERSRYRVPMLLLFSICAALPVPWKTSRAEAHLIATLE